MIRKFSSLLLLLLATTTAFAETSRYMVVMNRPLRDTKLRVVSNAEDRAGRNVRELAAIDVFGADLTAAEAAELRRADGVESVSPVVPRSILSVETEVKPAAEDPYAKQVTPWGLDAINAAELWPMTRGKGVNVAVVDTGISFSHPDLAGNLAGGFNAFSTTALPEDEHGHGTHVAGTIAAHDNAFGTVGVAPEATLWAIKALNATGNGTDETIAAGIDWVIAKKREIGGPWVVNMSIGADVPSAAEERAFTRAAEAGIVLIAAAGNNSWEFTTYPARYPMVLAVGAVDQNFARAYFSNFGNYLDVVGPGVDMPSSYLPGLLRYAEMELGPEKVPTFGLKGSSLGSVRAKFVDCGYGRPEDFPVDVQGKIAVIERGPAGAALYFREKARNAKEAGAVAVVIYNSAESRDPSYNDWTLLTDDQPSDYEYPVTLAVSTDNGKKILASPGSDLLVTIGSHDYARLSGTSMACPHAAGTAALLLALDPTAKRIDITRALERGARDIGAPGWDFFTAWGAIDAYEAARVLVPERFGATPPPARRRSVRP
ncbi:MAG TPA: S8 family serine peptidase [Thermoanaerobaculia bacterium]|nr:S8 family serine peptidase [Thermoanaerobaculia bacterium]